MWQKLMENDKGSARVVVKNEDKKMAVKTNFVGGASEMTMICYSPGICVGVGTQFIKLDVSAQEMVS